MTKCTVKNCCHRSDGEVGGCPFDTWDSRERSLIITSLEIGQELADLGKVSFRAAGSCMLPCILSGDLLTVESRRIEQVKVGEIVVFRRNGVLFAHRAISGGSEHERVYVITKPDRTEEGNDGPSYAEDVLGVVTTIRRDNADQPLNPQPLNGLTALSAAGSEFFDRRMRPGLYKALGKIQQKGWYRSIATKWLDGTNHNRRFIVRVPLSAAQSHDIYRKFSADEFDPKHPMWHGEPASRWNLDVFLKGEKTPVCTTTVARHPPDCPRGSGWWVEKEQIQGRYRGTGLEDALFREVGTILTRSGMKLEGRSKR